MKRRRIIICMAFACVMLAGIGSTIAYYTDTGHVANALSFSGPDGMNGILTEPAWIPENGLEALPNQTIPKDPQVTNTSELDMDILTALEVTFVYGEAAPDPAKRGSLLSAEDMAYVCDVYKIDWNADAQGDWVRFEGETGTERIQHFYYDKVLKRNYPGKGDTTAPLFTKLVIPEDVNNERYAHIQAMGGFDIKINGTVVQQMSGETEFGLDTARDAYEAGIFVFD